MKNMIAFGDQPESFFVFEYVKTNDAFQCSFSDLQFLHSGVSKGSRFGFSFTGVEDDDAKLTLFAKTTFLCSYEHQQTSYDAIN
uniref:Uncharacterized protein n=1 Tax=Lactuca sativa TaxID=4236 RepID=A0A9R1VY79_LACSA|nr:hypothetical protein LSAT_V11C400211010 [Lactuca sativa]